MRVLFISYHFSPSPSVGAKRLSYWAGNINSHYPEIHCDVVTTTPSDGGRFPFIDNVYCVPDPGTSPLRHCFKHDQGVTWRGDLKRFLLRHEAEYDACVITGGPFMHFGVTRIVKRKYRCGVALDFRDPFSNNPALTVPVWKQSIKAFFERGFIKQADALIVVNKYCRDLLRGDDKPTFIIDNGYDEDAIGKIAVRRRRSGDRVKIVYAGKLLAHRDPKPFLEVLAEAGLQREFEFTHIGDPEALINRHSAGADNIIELGRMDYDDTMRVVADNDVGIIFTSGENFESTTKIFDYIGLDKSIMIVTDGEPQTGSLHDITASHPSVFWCRNRHDEIRATLKKISAADLFFEYPDKTLFSRRRGLQILAESVLPVLTGESSAASSDGQA